MANAYRITVHLDRRVYRALKRKARRTKQNLSTLVDDALRVAMKEDAADARAFRERAKEPNVPYEVVRRRLKRDGLL